ncbi:MAG: hypothetical protein ABI456_23350 [Ktedonobacteraceae bacterium]
MLKVLRAGLISLGVLVLPVYLLLVRRWYLHWGVTGAERRQSMPGDEQVHHPRLETTRAITIEAPPAMIWPWLVQMGYRRGGWYTYDRLDNGGMPSATYIIAELQNIKVGDIIPTGPGGGFTVTEVKPDQSLVMALHTASETGTGADMSTACVLLPLDAEHTRLFVRQRVDFKPHLREIIYYLLFDPGDFLMTRKMLRGIKERAERSSRATAVVPAIS